MKPISEDDVDTCTRKAIEIDGENYYIIQGKYKVQVTVPHENRPERYKERKSVDILCQEVLNMSNLLHLKEKKDEKELQAHSLRHSDAD